MLNSIPKKVYPGRVLKKELGLENFKSVIIRKIINIPLQVFIIYYNSRFPNTFIPLSKIKELETFTIQKLHRDGFTYTTEQFRMTPPMKLENIASRLPNNSIVIKVDITGEYFANKKLYMRSK